MPNLSPPHVRAQLMVVPWYEGRKSYRCMTPTSCITRKLPREPPQRRYTSRPIREQNECQSFLPVVYCCLSRYTQRLTSLSVNTLRSNPRSCASQGRSNHRHRTFKDTVEKSFSRPAFLGVIRPHVEYYIQPTASSPPQGTLEHKRRRSYTCHGRRYFFGARHGVPTTQYVEHIPKRQALQDRNHVSGC